MKIFEAYGDFILDGTKIINKDAESDNFFAALPCAFYLDILLMAYQLSNEDDKATLANYILSSITTGMHLKLNLGENSWFIVRLLSPDSS